MGLLKNIFKGAVKIGAPILGQALIPIPGVGAAIGGAVGNTIGSGRPTIGKALGGAAAGAIGGGILSKIPGAAALGGAAGGRAAGSTGASAGGGVLGKIFGSAAKYGPDILQTGIAGYGAYEGAKAQKRGDKMQQQALDMAMREYAANEPLRAKARSLMLAPQAPRQDLSALYRSTENPWG